MARVSVIVTVRDATREGLRRVQRSMNSLNRGILQTLSSVFSDGIGQGLALGFQKAMSNPYVAAAVVALVAVLTLQLGAALAGALTLAFGGAFIALGVMAVKNSKEVKAAFSKELASLKKEFAGAAKPLIPVLVHAAKKMGEVGRNFAPMFKQAMKDAAPVLKNFLDELARGIDQFAKRGFKPMMDAFNDLITEMDWEGFFTDLGDAFAHLGKAVSNNKEAVAGVMDSLLGLIPKAIHLIADMAEAWGKIQPFVSENWKTIKLLLTPAVTALGIAFRIIGDIMVALAGPLSLVNRIMKTFYEEAIKPVAEFIGRIFAPIWRGLVDGFTEGWKILEVGLVPVLKDLWQVAKDTAITILGIFVPGLKDLDDNAASAGKTIKQWIIDKMQQLSDWLVEHRDEIKEWAQKIADGAITAARWIKDTLIPAIMEAWGWIQRNWRLILALTGISLIINLIRWLTTAWGWIRRNWRIIFAMTGVGAVITIVGWLRTAWGWLSRNWTRVLRFTFPGASGIISALRTLWGWVSRNWSRVVNFSFTMSGPIGTIRKLLGFAHGGIVGKVGAAATGGVRSNMTMVGENGPELVNLAPGSHVRSNPDTRRLMRGGGGGGGAAFIFKSSGRRVDDLLLEILREAIHQRGGDPVAVLGG
jgi:hypothetical protein